MNLRKRYIDIAKGFGIILIELSHIDAYDWFWIFAPFFVSVFFVLSGITFDDKRYHTIKSIVISKSKSLLKPYLLFSVLYLIINIYGNQEYIINTIGVLYSRFSLFPFASDGTNYFLQPDNIVFLRMATNAPLWFLSSMFVSFILFVLIIKSEKYGKSYVFVVISIYIIITYCLTFLKVLLPWSIDSSFMFSLLIYTGYKLKDIEFKYSLINFILILLLTTIYIYLAYTNGFINLSIRVYGNNIILFLITALLGSYILLFTSNLLTSNKIGYVLSIIGQNSMVIFCTHCYINVNTYKLLDKAGIENKFLTTIILVVVATTLGSYLSKGLKKYSII